MTLRWDEPQTWAPEAVLAGVVLAYGLLETSQEVYAKTQLLLLVLAFTVATALVRHLPGLSLAIVWLAGFYQLVFSVQLLTIEIAVAAVAFGAARWGNVLTVVLSGLSIPGAALVFALAASMDLLGLLVDLDQTQQLLDAAYRFGDTWQVGAVLLGTMALGAPWLAGLALRFVARAQASEASQEIAQAETARAQVETVQAQEIARLQEEQARLARDVHDVVGHSLAVILAQAESAQFLPDDPVALKSTMATIATSARSSLQDVRQVLAATHSGAPTQPGGLDALVRGVRSTGQEVVLDEVGSPRPLPPELEVVAYRVMQEMLTNAVKHGRRDRPIRVERHWPHDAFERDLRLEVSNTAADPAETQPLNAVDARLDEPGGGQGLAGMRRRVEAVGGRLDVRRRADTFTATAWVPVRA